MGEQLKLFDFKCEIEKKARKFHFECWEMHDFRPLPKEIIQINRFEREDGSKGCDFFRNGFIVKVYEKEEKALCWMPKITGCEWTNNYMALVGYLDLDPVVEYGFNHLDYRKKNPLPLRIKWRGETIKI